jgi:RNA ligase (TIGR02306 family)
MCVRKLASIQKIWDIKEIPNADRIGLARVLGWKVVVEKNKYSVNDLVVYCEIDSILPDRPEFEFLRPKKFRIKTAKIRGTISQGICFPISVLPSNINPEEGLDITDILGVKKYEPESEGHLGGEQLGRFPHFIYKTDETRVQNLQDVLDKYKNTSCYITEKLDGSSATYFSYNNEFGVCGRNARFRYIEDNPNFFWQFAKAYGIQERLLSLNKNIALQGEIVGPKIQGNKYKLKNVVVYFFNAFDIDAQQYLNINDFNEIIKSLGLLPVPLLNDNFTLINDIDSLTELSRGKSSINNAIHREGIVIRPNVEIVDNSFRTLHANRLSFKVVNPDFLLKEEK